MSLQCITFFQATSKRVMTELSEHKQAMATVHTMLKAGSNLLYVDCCSPMALFQLNEAFLLKAMPDLLGSAAKVFDEVIKTRALVCRLLSPLENDQVWKARRTYIESVSMVRLHMCAGRMVGIGARTLYLANVFLHQAREQKGWSVLGQAELAEVFNDRDITDGHVNAVVAERLRTVQAVRQELEDGKSTVEIDASPLQELVAELREHRQAEPLSNGNADRSDNTAKVTKAERHAKAAAIAKAKRTTIGALHAYMSQLATLTSRVDPLVHCVFVALESPLFGYWLQSDLSAAMLRANSAEARNVAVRSTAGDLWLVRPGHLLTTLGERVGEGRDATVHAVALTQLPLVVQVDANDFAQFVQDFWATTKRVAEETDDLVY